MAELEAYFASDLEVSTVLEVHLEIGVRIFEGSTDAEMHHDKDGLNTLGNLY